MSDRDGVTDWGHSSMRSSPIPCLIVGQMFDGKRLLLIVAEKNGVGVTGAADMKTPSARKQASRRGTAGSGQKPTPLRGE